jgi:hypothetical protein
LNSVLQLDLTCRPHLPIYRCIKLIQPLQERFRSLLLLLPLQLRLEPLQCICNSPGLGLIYELLCC